MTYYVIKVVAHGITMYMTDVEKDEGPSFKKFTVGYSSRLGNAKKFDKYLDALERCGRGDIVAMVEDGTVTDMEFRLGDVRVYLVPTLPEGVVKETFKEDRGDRFLQYSFTENEWLALKADKDASEYYGKLIAEWAKRDRVKSYRLHKIETNSRDVFDRLMAQKNLRDCGVKTVKFRMSGKAAEDLGPFVAFVTKEEAE